MDSSGLIGRTNTVYNIVPSFCEKIIIHFLTTDLS
jgi:hypothetical protein